jgi:hypothetical protein
MDGGGKGFGGGRVINIIIRTEEYLRDQEMKIFKRSGKDKLAFGLADRTKKWKRKSDPSEVFKVQFRFKR